MPRIPKATGHLATGKAGLSCLRAKEIRRERVPGTSGFALAVNRYLIVVMLTLPEEVPEAVNAQESLPSLFTVLANPATSKKPGVATLPGDASGQKARQAVIAAEMHIRKQGVTCGRQFQIDSV